MFCGKVFAELCLCFEQTWLLAFKARERVLFLCLLAQEHKAERMLGGISDATARKAGEHCQTVLSLFAISSNTITLRSLIQYSRIGASRLHMLPNANTSSHVVNSTSRSKKMVAGSEAIGRRLCFSLGPLVGRKVNAEECLLLCLLPVPTRMPVACMHCWPAVLVVAFDARLRSPRLLNRNSAVIATLIAAGADVSKSNRKGKTPLHVAVAASNDNVLALLVDHASIDKADRKGRTPLFTAAKMANLQAIQRLVGAGVDVSKADKKGTTPCHVAASLADERAVKPVDCGWL